MENEEIEIIDEWISNKARDEDTGRDECGDYFIAQPDLYDFCNILTVVNPDLIGISCTIGPNGVWIRQYAFNDAEYI